MWVVECGERRDNEKGDREESLGRCTCEKIEMKRRSKRLSGTKWINSNQK